MTLHWPEYGGGVHTVVTAEPTLFFGSPILIESRSTSLCRFLVAVVCMLCSHCSSFHGADVLYGGPEYLVGVYPWPTLSGASLPATLLSVYCRVAGGTLQSRDVQRRS